MWANQNGQHWARTQGRGPCQPLFPTTSLGGLASLPKGHTQTFLEEKGLRAQT